MIIKIAHISKNEDKKSYDFLKIINNLLHKSNILTVHFTRMTSSVKTNFFRISTLRK